MEVIAAFVLALIVLGALALRFGYDSRDQGFSVRQELAHLAPSQPSRTDVSQTPYPTLALIDRLLGERSPRFACCRHAEALEGLARSLTAEYWSDSVWSTGAIQEPALRRVVDILSQRRADLDRFAGTPSHAA